VRRGAQALRRGLHEHLVSWRVDAASSSGTAASGAAAARVVKGRTKNAGALLCSRGSAPPFLLFCSKGYSCCSKAVEQEAPAEALVVITLQASACLVYGGRCLPLALRAVCACVINLCLPLPPRALAALVCKQLRWKGSAGA